MVHFFWMVQKGYWGMIFRDEKASFMLDKFIGGRTDSIGFYSCIIIRIFVKVGKNGLF